MLPPEVYGGAWRSGHVQGIALDADAGHLYFSFTDLLVKTDLYGKQLGSVAGIDGHLGDLTFHGGLVHGSLERKSAQAFFVAVFDPDRIIAMDMDPAEAMTIAPVEQVAADFVEGRHGCSGIDGITFGPRLGDPGQERLLTLAYGIYAGTGDDQVLLQYDGGGWRKHLVRTGNTTYGVQNLEYDSHTRLWFMAVYRGVNHTFFTLDGRSMRLAERGLYHRETGVWGWEAGGQFGLASLGDGRYYIVDKGESGGRQTATARLHRWTGEAPNPFLVIDPK